MTSKTIISGNKSGRNSGQAAPMKSTQTSGYNNKLCAEIIITKKPSEKWPLSMSWRVTG